MPDSPVPMRALLAGARRKQAALLDLLRRLVQVESPSDDKAAVDACVALAAAQAKALGGRVKLHRQRAFGDVLEAHFGPRTRKPAESKAGAAKPILLLGHLDTVWPLGTLKSMPFRVAEGRVWGPGTLDMKAGVAMAFTAIELLGEVGLLNRELVLLLNSDEEVGSPISRPITESLAAKCASVYVLEPAQGLAYKTVRKGTGNWRIEVQGIAAHAGVDFEKGANAIRELARMIEKVSGWTDLKRGLTVSVGMVGGGSKTNVIPAQAWAEVDVRIARKADGQRIAQRFAGLKPQDKRCTLAVTGGINRPPMERTKQVVALYHLARKIAGELGFSLTEIAVGGGSDGNFTGGIGISTLDGLGAVGDGAHATHEHVIAAELPRRAALLAGLIEAID